MDDEWTHVFPRGDLTGGRLTFESGVAPRLLVRGADTGDAAARCALPDPAPKATFARGDLTIDYRGFFRWFFAGRYPPGIVELSKAIPWSVDVRGGIAKAELDLRALPLERLEIGGGVAKAKIRLGARPGGGIVPLRISGGAASVEITHPRGSGARLRVSGGAAKVDLDDQHWGAVGGGMTVNNGAWNDKGDGFDIKIGGGAARVSVEEE